MATISRARGSLSPADVTWLVEQACRAPSIHNSQPWLFSYDAGTFELRADTRRGLLASDPDGRELVISCGAALYNLRLAVRKLGHDATVFVFPDSDDPQLLARIDVVESRPADPAERRTFAALIRRHTHRGGFDDRALSPELAVLLQHAAEAEGAQLLFVADPRQRAQVLDLARAAARELERDEAVAAEIAAWTPPQGSARRDGVPATAYAGRAAKADDDLPARDYDRGRGIGTAPPPSGSGAIAILVTEHDVEAGWLVAGQALERVLVTAAAAGAYAALHSQLTEVEHRRSELRRELWLSGHPQILVRFGYTTEPVPTPRRPVSEILELR